MNVFAIKNNATMWLQAIGTCRQKCALCAQAKQLHAAPCMRPLGVAMHGAQHPAGQQCQGKARCVGRHEQRRVPAPAQPGSAALPASQAEAVTCPPRPAGDGLAALQQQPDEGPRRPGQRASHESARGARSAALRPATVRVELGVVRVGHGEEHGGVLSRQAGDTAAKAPAGTGGGAEVTADGGSCHVGEHHHAVGCTLHASLAACGEAQGQGGRDEHEGAGRPCLLWGGRRGGTASWGSHARRRGWHGEAWWPQRGIGPQVCSVACGDQSCAPCGYIHCPITHRTASSLSRIGRQTARLPPGAGASRGRPATEGTAVPGWPP